MSQKRKRHSTEFKAKVALEAVCMANCYSSGSRQLKQAAAMLFPCVAV